MTHTITAMFTDRAAADAAVNQLVQQVGISQGQITVHAADAASSASTGTTGSEGGLWASLKELFVPDEDRYAYAEGIRRGGTVVSVNVDDSTHDEAMNILEHQGAVDLDAQEAEWRQSGWTGYQPGATTGVATGATSGTAGGYSDEVGIGMAPTSGTYAASGTGTGSSTGGTVGHGAAQTGIGSAGREDVIPVVEEQLRVGKRDVERGRVRVRSYVVETPVTEQVTLRDEHVDVHRRAVDRPVTDADRLFEERTIEAVETDEEAVVAKEARVTEELVIQKGSTERVETVQDTVRHTEVEVDDATGQPRSTAATGVSGTSSSNPPGTVASRTADQTLGTNISGTNPNKG
ncbi:YsnF/AvaK domain-containing protein, partial [Teichococcus vastitatis]